jgi:hypothetical protein
MHSSYPLSHHLTHGMPQVTPPPHILPQPRGEYPLRGGYHSLDGVPFSSQLGASPILWGSHHTSGHTPVFDPLLFGQAESGFVASPTSDPITDDFIAFGNSDESASEGDSREAFGSLTATITQLHQNEHSQQVRHKIPMYI